MIAVLVVDDDSEKSLRVKQLIAQELGADNVSLTAAESVSAAAELMRHRVFDLLVIDLNLPVRDGVQPSSDGGIRLLRQVGRGTGDLKRPTLVVGVTAYENLAGSHLSEFHQQGWALVTYSPSTSEWEEPIVNQCRQVAEIRRRYSVSSSDQVDVGICTALTDPELEAVLRALDSPAQVCPVIGDTTRYRQCTLQTGNRSIKIVLASASEMGVAAMAALTSSMLLRFKPSLMLLGGICAGFKAEIGDLVAGESSLNYESGKWTQDSVEHEVLFAPAPRYVSASPGFLAGIRQFAVAKRSEILQTAGEYVTDAPKIPALRVGPVACGATVVESESIVQGLIGDNRKLEGLEMESYGFYLACQNSYPGLNYGMVKAVCDKGIYPKKDEFQNYASYLSAATIVRFIRHEATIPGGLLNSSP